MEAHELATGLWTWTGRHDGIGHDVGCAFYQSGGEVLLIDPLLPPEDPEGFWKALDRDVLPGTFRVHVLITSPSHTRSAQAMADRYEGARIWAPKAVAPEAEKRGLAVTDPFEPGDPLPGGLRAFASGKPDEVVYWIPEHRALVIGNVLIGGGEGLGICPEPLLPEGTTQGRIREALVPLTALGVELILPSHGAPVPSGGGEILRSLAG